MTGGWFILLIIVTPGHEPVAIRDKVPLTLVQCQRSAAWSADALSRSMPTSVITWACVTDGVAA